MNRKFHNYIAGLLVALSSTVALLGFNASASAVVDNTPDCDNVAIIRCGAFSPDALRQKAAQDDVPKIMSHMGITQQSLKGSFVDGIVWRDGRVTVGDKTVATHAMTAGRNFGGTPIPGTNAGTYSTSRFVTEGQTAFVRMIDGKFAFAIIKACGNPVKATPTPQQPPAEQPKPAYECVNLTYEKLSRTKVRFTAKASASGGAKIEQYEFGFGDGMGITVPNASYTYDYKKTGTFLASVVIHVKVNGDTKKVTSPDCKKNVTIKPAGQPEACIYDDSLPKNSPDCKEVVLSSTTTREQPQKIADTGPSTVAAGLVGTSALSYGGYAYLSSRRNILSAIFKK